YAAAKKDILNSQIEILHQAGFNVIAIDVDAFAIENVINYITSEKEYCYVVVDMGYSTTVISVIDSGTTKVTREIQQAGLNLTKALQRNLQCDEKKAEELKSEIGIIIDPNEKIKLQAEGNKEALQTSTILSMEIKAIIDETSRIINFYLSQNLDRTINRIFLTGGTSAIKNIDQLFEKQSNIQTLRLDPFSNMETEIDIDSIKKLNFAVATGCAIRNYL
ncbi:MAG: pilus assembly protein PilM, partial [bacterium]|nr:pilus assembly protein PilM [bacterium]